MNFESLFPDSFHNQNESKLFAQTNPFISQECVLKKCCKKYKKGKRCKKCPD